MLHINIGFHSWCSANTRSVNVRRGIQATQGFLWVCFHCEQRVKSGSPSHDGSTCTWKRPSCFVLLKSSRVQIAANREMLFLSLIPKGIHSVLKNKPGILLTWTEGRFGLKWWSCSHKVCSSITSDVTIGASISQHWSENTEKEIQILGALGKALALLHLETSDADLAGSVCVFTCIQEQHWVASWEGSWSGSFED